MEAGIGSVGAGEERGGDEEGECGEEEFHGFASYAARDFGANENSYVL
jgi:hypothetical protein